MVEAPGTAPGSALLISQHVYRHSWQASKVTIGVIELILKNSFYSNAVSGNPSVIRDTFSLCGCYEFVFIIRLHRAAWPWHFNLWDRVCCHMLLANGRGRIVNEWNQ